MNEWFVTIAFLIMNLSFKTQEVRNIAIIIVKGVAYLCIIHYISKSEATDL